VSGAALKVGDVEIELGGEKRVLRPTLDAALTISRQNGGILAATNAVGRFDFDVIVSVVTLGLGLKGNDAKAVPEMVFEAGLTNLIDPVSTYLTIIANGGKPLSGGEGKKDPPASA
jgi:hypothetical protein